ncbi:MAG: type II CAAX endopeptidase family protein [Myxococcota bacterium]
MRASALPRLAGFYVAMLAIALVAMAATGSLASFTPAADPRAWLVAVSMGVGVGGATVLLSRVLSHVFRWARLLEEELRAVLGDLSPRQAFVVAALSSVGEEALFRGLLQPLLGLWIAAAIFGVLHVGPNVRFAPWTVMAFAAGLAFGGMFAWTGTLLAPILAHFLINFLNLRRLTPRQGGAELHLGASGGEHMARH